jgi:hypothetical protein
MLQSRVDDAVLWFEKAHSANFEHSIPHAYVAATCALKGETGRAANELAQARKLTTDDRYSSIARSKAKELFWGGRSAN